jgi:hypothetical protein
MRVVADKPCECACTIGYDVQERLGMEMGSVIKCMRGVRGVGVGEDRIKSWVGLIGCMGCMG